MTRGIVTSPATLGGYGIEGNGGKRRQKVNIYINMTNLPFNWRSEIVLVSRSLTTSAE
jgi:hypothetical protein